MLCGGKESLKDGILILLVKIVWIEVVMWMGKGLVKVLVMVYDNINIM